MAPILGHRLLRALVAFYEKMLFLWDAYDGRRSLSQSLHYISMLLFVPFTMFGSHNTLNDIHLTHCIRKGGIKLQPFDSTCSVQPSERLWLQLTACVIILKPCNRISGNNLVQSKNLFCIIAKRTFRKRTRCYNIILPTLS